MPMDEKSRELLQSMAQAGVPANLITQLATNLNSNPNADKVVSDRVLNQQTFSQYVSTIDERVKKQVNEKLSKFAAIKDTLANLKKDSQAYKDLKKDHDDLRDALLKDNYQASDIDPLTTKTKEGIDALLKLSEMDFDDTDITIDDTDIDLTKGNNMPFNKTNANSNSNSNSNTDNYLTADDPRFRQTMAELALGSVNVQSAVFAATLRYRQLYGKDPEDVQEFAKKVTEGFSQGKSVEQTAEEHWKFSDKEKEIATTNQNTLIEQAKKDAEADTLKRLKASGVDVDRLAYQQNEGSKRHLSNIISRNSNTSNNIDDKLNSNKDDDTGDGNTNNKTVKFKDTEFELPEASKLRNMSIDNKLPIERRPITPLHGRSNRVDRALAYVAEKKIDLTAD
jgi:hypothetical protein